MRIGLIGSGNMARALARGLGGPILCSDIVPERATALAAEVGGRAASNGEVARESDLVILCHKPAQTEEVAGQIAAQAEAVLSILGGVPLERLRAAYPRVPVYRTMPNIAVEIGRGVLCLVDDDAGEPDRFAQLQERLRPLGEVVVMPEALLGAGTAVAGVMPAYAALLAEAQIDAAVRAGVPAPLAARLVGEAMEGALALLRARNMDTLAVRREVTSPGGVTARGLAALEAAGVRAAFDEAMDAVLDGGA